MEMISFSFDESVDNLLKEERILQSTIFRTYTIAKIFTENTTAERGSIQVQYPEIKVVRDDDEHELDYDPTEITVNGTPVHKRYIREACDALVDDLVSEGIISLDRFGLMISFEFNDDDIRELSVELVDTDEDAESDEDESEEDEYEQDDDDLDDDESDDSEDEYDEDENDEDEDSEESENRIVDWFPVE
jgi:hypothetical protein